MVEKASKKEGQKPKPRKAPAKKGLTDRQKLFATEYLKDRNATQAAIRAGYSPKTAQEQSSRLLSNVMVRAFVDERAEKIAARIEVTAERIMAEYARIAFADIRRVVKWGADMRAIHDADGNIIGYTSGVGVINSDEIDEDAAASISEIAETREGVRIKLHSKVDALHKLGLELGMFKQGVKVGGDADNPSSRWCRASRAALCRSASSSHRRQQPQSQLIHASSSRPAPRPRPPPPSRRCFGPRRTEPCPTHMEATHDQPRLGTAAIKAPTPRPCRPHDRTTGPTTVERAKSQGWSEAGALLGR